ncbi:recombinase family protein [Dongia rigui]|uniref:Recombinase family protein n=1 Tax=Dongia rigui TaxID=940149 RepID=A0ABU5DZI2_9PROT|nr:recombinase family protein [Dongia rigui]MDY0872653.1 recombinase family protein [Dongia rigui]
MAIVGYARVSTTGQTLAVQHDMLKNAGCEKIYAEKKSGLDGKRVELAKCLDYVREGDVLLVTKLDRLARSTTDFYAILARLKDKGVGFRCLDQSGLDTTTKHGKLMVGLLALIAEFEADIRKERQLEGIAKAKERGVAFGRQRVLTDDQIAQLKARRQKGELIRDLMTSFGLSKASIYRLLGSP